jgi:hypothetical protein
MERPLFPRRFAMTNRNRLMNKHAQNVMRKEDTAESISSSERAIRIAKSTELGMIGRSMIKAQDS